MYEDTEADDFEDLPQPEDWSKAHYRRDGEDEIRERAERIYEIYIPF